MNYLLDTNIIIIYSRGGEVARKIETQYELFSSDNKLFISVVTLGEIDAFSKKFGLGDRRLSLIQSFIDSTNKIGINFQELISAYGDIDTYSQGRLPTKTVKFSSRNMGKNDLWIAATARVLGTRLLTTDRDFDHLKDEYIDVEYIDIELYR